MLSLPSGGIYDLIDLTGREGLHVALRVPVFVVEESVKGQCQMGGLGQHPVWTA